MVERQQRSIATAGINLLTRIPSPDADVRSTPAIGLTEITSPLEEFAGRLPRLFA